MPATAERLIVEPHPRDVHDTLARLAEMTAAASRPILRDLTRRVRELESAEMAIDHEDAEVGAAFYAALHAVIDPAIAARAETLEDLKAKTEALVLINGGLDFDGEVNFGLGDTTAERMIASILADLVRMTRRTN